MDSNERHFARKDAWKNIPGHRYTAEQLREPARLGDWKLAERDEGHLWPCP